MDTSDTTSPTVSTSPHARAQADLLTLQEAADALKVHYMTAYRWVRRGELSAFKAGGRLRVRRADLDIFMSSREVDPAFPRLGQRTDWPTHIDRLYELLRAGDSVEAVSMVRKVVADGAPAGDVYVRLLAPALHRIGQDWAEQRICIAEEHRATEIVTTIVKRQGEAFRRRGPRRGAAVTLTPAGDTHAIGATMVSDFLRAGGYDVHHLGANVPTEDLATFLTKVAVDLVCVSVTACPDESMYADVAEAARRDNPDADVLFGGQAADPALVAAAGATYVSSLQALHDRLTEPASV